MDKSRSFKELVVWQKSVALVIQIYSLVKKMPKCEEYGMASQMSRAAVSIASNIAEGSKRGTKKDFLQFLRVANGSAAELETQLIIVEKIYNDLDGTTSMGLLSEVQKMLAVLIQKLALPETKNSKL